MGAINEHDRVVLTADLPAEKLASGDVGTVVHVYREWRRHSRWNSSRWTARPLPS